jgi:hypothetical protein
MRLALANDVRRHRVRISRVDDAGHLPVPNGEWARADDCRRGAPPALVSATLCDGVVAAIVVLAMCPGPLVPKIVLDGLSERAKRRMP